MTTYGTDIFNLQPVQDGQTDTWTDRQADKKRNAAIGLPHKK